MYISGCHLLKQNIVVLRFMWNKKWNLLIFRSLFSLYILFLLKLQDCRTEKSICLCCREW